MDVHKENERKRKRELGDENGADDQSDTLEKPKEGLKRAQKQTKKPKLDDDKSESKSASISKLKSKEHTAEEDEAIRSQKAEKRRLKRERKKEKNTSKREKKEARKVEKQQSTADKPVAEKSQTLPKKSSSGKGSEVKRSKSNNNELEEESSDEEDSEAQDEVAALLDDEAEVDSEDDAEADGDEDRDNENDEGDEDMEEASGFALDGFNELDTTHSGAESISSDASSEPETPTFDISGQLSSASSSSSIVPPSESDTNNAQAKSRNSKTASTQVLTFANQPVQKAKSKPSIPQQPLPELTTPSAQVNGETNGPSKFPKLTEVDSEKLKERLESRLAALRAARKADGPDGKPARNRQDLIDARRQKQERRKQHKKELRQKVRQEQSAEDEAARLRGGSGSPIWSPNAILSPREPQNNFSFGKVAFADGQEVDTGSGSAVDGKKKGPQDAKTALEAANKKQDRLNGLDEDKRNNIEEKDRWLNAKKRIQGEKVRDNTSLLKKTLKRQDKGKAKSEKEWTDRIEGVQAGKAAKQRKRDDNLKKRKEEKGSKKGKSKPAPKPKKRPGFEGSWKLGTKGGRGP